MRAVLLMGGGGGLEVGAGTGAGADAGVGTADDELLNGDAWLSLRDFGAGGCKYDFRL